MQRHQQVCGTATGFPPLPQSLSPVRDGGRPENEMHKWGSYFGLVPKVLKCKTDKYKRA